MKFKIPVILFWLGCALCAQAQNQQYLAYIAQYKDLAIEQMKAYRIPASITLAQGLFESAAGKSELALKSNNHFGIKCGSDWTGRRSYHDDDALQECFRAYSSVRASYEDHSRFLRNKSRYASLFKLKETDYKGWATGLKAAGYATNPAYAQRLISIIEQYQLYQYDSGSSSSGFSRKTEIKMSSLGLNYTDRQVLLNNGILLVVARQGDTLERIAAEFHRKTKTLMKYNDMYQGYPLSEGEWVYVEKKKRHASTDYRRKRYVVKEGDSMHSISQQVGIRLKSLYKMNGMLPTDDMPKPGTAIRVR